MEEIGLKDFPFREKGRAIFDRHVLGRHENHYFIVYEIFTDDEPVLGDEAQSYKRFTKRELEMALKEKKEEFGGAYFFVLEHFYPEFLS